MSNLIKGTLSAVLISSLVMTGGVAFAKPGDRARAKVAEQNPEAAAQMEQRQAERQTQFETNHPEAAAKAKEAQSARLTACDTNADGLIDSTEAQAEACKSTVQGQADQAKADAQAQVQAQQGTTTQE